MNATPQKTDIAQVRPPRLIQSLAGGFNAVANHIHLILLPVALDMLLWFGPHVRLKTLVEPVMVEFVRFARSTSTGQNRQLWEGMENLWSQFLDVFNLTSLLSTFPVGVPALMGGQSPMETPVGTPAIIEAGSLLQVVFSWITLTLAGLALGTIYFAAIARCSASTAKEIECASNLPQRASGGRVPPLKIDVLAWQVIQVVLMVIILFFILMLVMIPTVLMTSFVFLLSPLLAQFILLMIIFSAVWLLVPLIFSPHGIFLCGLNVLNAMLSSTRVVRIAMPGTGLFLVVAVILYQGLGVLWRVPPDNSWMALIGILGHAFISTGLLAASFIYYRNGLAYVQALRQLTFKNV